MKQRHSRVRPILRRYPTGQRFAALLLLSLGFGCSSTSSSGSDTSSSDTGATGAGASAGNSTGAASTAGGLGGVGEGGAAGESSGGQAGAGGQAVGGGGAGNAGANGGGGSGAVGGEGGGGGEDPDAECSSAQDVVACLNGKQEKCAWAEVATTSSTSSCVYATSGPKCIRFTNNYVNGPGGDPPTSCVVGNGEAPYWYRTTTNGVDIFEQSTSGIAVLDAVAEAMWTKCNPAIPACECICDDP